MELPDRATVIVSLLIPVWQSNELMPTFLKRGDDVFEHPSSRRKISIVSGLFSPTYSHFGVLFMPWLSTRTVKDTG